MRPVTRTHPAVRRFREARDGRAPRSLFAEGRRLARELLRSPLPIRECLYTAGRPDLQDVLALLRRRGVESLAVPAEVMAFVSDVAAPPGLVLRADRPATPPAEELVPRMTLGVLLDGLQSPANAGAVVRAAQAAGAEGVLTTPGTADLFGPKALRASAGSAFHLPIAPAPPWAALAGMKRISLVAADPTAPRAHWDWDWRRPTLLILGAEGRGLSDLSGLTVERLRIPMAGGVESLNVAVAAGVMLMEAARRRAP